MSDGGFQTGAIFKGAAIGGAIAGVINVILYFVGGAIGAEYMMLQPGATEMAPIPAAMPFFMSLVPSLLGGALLVGLTKARPEKAWTFFLIACGVAFVVMLGGPPMQMSGDTPAIIVLELMHVVAVAGCLWGIKTFGEG